MAPLIGSNGCEHVAREACDYSSLVMISAASSQRETPVTDDLLTQGN
jgi:hypothetical protein